MVYADRSRTRLKEHQKAVFTGDDSNAPAYHMWFTGHDTQWTDTEVLEANVMHRKD